MSRNPDTQESPDVIPIGISPARQELLRVESEVQAKYAPKLATAGFLRRMYLRTQMRYELERQLEKLATRLPVYFRKHVPAS